MSTSFILDILRLRTNLHLRTYCTTWPCMYCSNMRWPSGNLDCNTWSITVQGPRAKIRCGPIDNPNPSLPPTLCALCMLSVAFKYSSSTVHTAESTWQLNYSFLPTLEFSHSSYVGIEICPQGCFVTINLCLFDQMQMLHVTCAGRISISHITVK